MNNILKTENILAGPDISETFIHLDKAQKSFAIKVTLPPINVWRYRLTHIKKIIARLILFLTLILSSSVSLAEMQKMLFADHPLAGKIWDMNSSRFLDEAALLAKINQADVLLLGETHDNLIHHEQQLKLLKARLTSGARPALMMEQINAENQAALDQALAGSNSEEVLDNVNALVKFSNAQDYQPLLAMAVGNKLPIIAANVPGQKLQPVIWRGYTAYDASELKKLMVEEVWSESRQNYLVTHMGGVHCGKLRDELRAGLTRSQRLRDALMVDTAVSSIGRGVVAIVGSSHARRDIGLPLYFAGRNPKARIVSIGFFEVSAGVTDPKAYLADSATGEAPYDVIWFTARVDRVDPCAEMGSFKEAETPAVTPHIKSIK